MPRDFIQISARNRTTGLIVQERLWSDRWDVWADVRNIDTGATETLAFQGAAGMVNMDDLPMVASLEVQELTLRFSAYGVDVDRIFRVYDPSHAPVTLWRGFLNTETRRLVAPAESYFVGFIDSIDLPTGAEGQEAFATITCVSTSQELTRWNPDIRSDASQRLRSATDNFFEGVNALRDREIFWARARVKVSSITQTPTPVVVPDTTLG
jgi:hypothetical protein